MTSNNFGLRNVIYPIENNFYLGGNVTKSNNTKRLPNAFQVISHMGTDGSAPITAQSSSINSLIPSRKKPSKESSICNAILNNFDNYFDNSTLHGLRYVGNSTLYFGERIFWALSFLIAMGFAIYFIINLYDKFNMNPVIMSFNPSVSTLDTIPFPAITICNVNVAKKDEAEAIVARGTNLQKRLLDDYCDSSTVTNNSQDDAEAGEWTKVRKFIIGVSQSCTEMIRVCLWQNMDIDCYSSINPILTDEGYCCSFNRLPKNYSMKDVKMKNDLNETFGDEIVDWNPEVGYPENASQNAVPLRTSGAGAHLGLTLVLDVLMDQYYCASTSSAAFKVLLSNPLETPKMADFGFLLSPGFESRIVVVPNLKDSSPNIRQIDVKKRQCYFANERYLQYFRIYTERNCHLECQANHTLNKCDCVPFFFPKNTTSTICSKSKENCVHKAKLELELRQLGVSNCECLPGCFELSYTSSVTSGKITNKAPRVISDKILRGEKLDYFVLIALVFRENMVVAHFFFQETRFIKQTKSELYGFAEFLSNTGGLLGLFMGFSFLSAVEIFYFFVVKVAINIFKKYRKSDNN